MQTPSAKIFAIGDIHGCHDKLDTLLRRLPFDKDRDTVIFLGDYINKGKDSAKVLDRLIEIRESCRHSYFLKGNHEQALLDYADGGDTEDLSYLRSMGVSATVKSYGSNISRLRDLSFLPAEHLDFLHALDFAVMIGSTIFTHADISKDMIAADSRGELAPPADRVQESTLLASRRLSRDEILFPGYTVVFGHIPFASPLVMEDRIGIDTGAVYGNLLTALELPARRFHHA